ncbi:suppressor APC domain-containing protein 2 isoform X2 [Loxodonta africana]|uniref:suppressor APC domain-containing protein 2 isoform X2 n=1 Tax=Loxodonta africana TaxID=9785 RepID=UPI000C813F5F|nr:suppressor APC domain-containing protein 2 isoform X2 [Loxodonta africana]
MAAAAMAERGRVLPSAAPAPGLGTEGLPRAFLQSLRTLFDILDDRRRGYVHLCEIESRWQGADARELPHGVLEGLRQAAPASGYLTFERFVAGLRFSLLSAESGPRGPARAPAQAGGPGARPAEKLLPQQRLLFAPADEPRTVLDKKALLPGARPPPSGPCCAARSLERLCGPREAAPGPAEPERSPSVDSGAGACRAMEVDTGDTRRASRVRGEHRRHTITNGVDCDLLKQLRELEQEKEVLLQGLEMMARGRDWYQQQLQRVQERQRRLGQSRAGTVSDASAAGDQDLTTHVYAHVYTHRNHPQPRHPWESWLLPFQGTVAEPPTPGCWDPPTSIMTPSPAPPHIRRPGADLLSTSTTGLPLGSEQQLWGTGVPPVGPLAGPGLWPLAPLSFQDLGAEGSPHSLGQLLPKVQEVARCLGELLAAACAGKGSAPPEHPNRAFPWSSSGPPGPSALAPASTSAPAWLQQTILMLKEQNRLLTKEVTDKSERITQLEQEKSALIKQLFEARAHSQQEAGPLDSTFI